MKDGDAKNRTALTRRGLLFGIGAAGAGTAAVAAGCKPGWSPPEDDPTGKALAKPHVPGADSFATGEERYAMTSCGQCPSGCGLRVRVVEGRAVRIEGNPANPLNRSGVGPRGMASLQALYDPDRLTGPMIRKGGELVSTTWDEALATVADRLTAVRAAGSHRLLVMSGRERAMMNDLLSRFCAAYGAPTFVDGRPGHSANLARAMGLSLGVPEVPAYDWREARFVLSLEAGLFEDSCQSVYMARVLADTRHHNGDARATIVHVSPRYDLAAHNADEWIRVRPGTSGAFALALCNYALESEVVADLAAVERSDGFDAFRQLAEEWPAARAAEVTGASESDIARVAAQMWNSRPAFALVDDRSLEFSNGVDTGRVTLALNALLGAVESPGAGVRLPVDVPLAAWPEPTVDEVAKTGAARPRYDGAGVGDYAGASSVHETLVGALEADGGPEVAMLYYANPLYARQQPARWRAALERIPTIVSFSPYMDDTTAELAHVVLPDHTYLERYEDAAAAPAIPRGIVGVRQPVIAPLHDTRATGDVVIDLAQRLGGSVGASFPWGSFREAVEHRLLGLHAARRGSVRGDSPREFIEALYREGVWTEAGEAAPRPAPMAFPPSWARPVWSGGDGYPLRLMIVRPLGYAVGSGANQSWLQHLRPHLGARAWRRPITMHPSAAPAGVSDGDRITVESEYGRAEGHVHLDPRLEPSTVLMQMGGGHEHFGRTAKRVGGANPMVLAAPGAVPDSGANILNGTRVRIRKGGA